MKRLFLLFSASLLLLSACSKESSPAEEETPELLEVTIQAEESVPANKEIKIEAAVSQGDKKVTEADEVKFEIWKSGQDEHEMLKAKNEKNGIYSVTKTFTEPGQYNIVSHVTANGMHNMPKKEITVEGQAQEDTGQHDDSSAHQDGHNDDGSDQHDDSTGEHSDSSGHAHTSGVEFDFTGKKSIKSNEPSQLSVSITQEGESISGASVKYEIWKEKDSRHDFIEASENGDGAYTASYRFPAAGKYSVKIHVEKGHIHDHTEESVEVAD